MFRTKSRESVLSKASKLSKKEVKMQNAAAASNPQRGRPGHLDPGQEHQVKKFRQMVSATAFKMEKEGNV